MCLFKNKIYFFLLCIFIIKNIMLNILIKKVNINDMKMNSLVWYLTYLLNSINEIAKI